jgi:hypothetical protein
MRTIELMSGARPVKTAATPKHKRLLISGVVKKRQHKISNKKRSTGISIKPLTIKERRRMIFIKVEVY